MLAFVVPSPPGTVLVALHIRHGLCLLLWRNITADGIIALRNVNRLSRCKSGGHVLGDSVLKKWK
jgi:hypothetical protein